MLRHDTSILANHPITKARMSRICVPVCAATLEEMRLAIEQGAEIADLIELRLDCLEQLDGAVEFINNLNETTKPLILTLRAPEEGGHASLDYDARRRFWTSLQNAPADSRFDLEYDLFQDLSAAKDFPNPNRVICSCHDFSGVPSTLDGLYEALAATEAGTIKVAIYAQDATDCLPIFRLLERARKERRELIAIAMGPAGIMTRILGPSRGSFLTYGALDEDSGTAPGQLTAADLRTRYRIDRIDQTTEVFGIMGSPVGHSLSPRIHNAAFAATEMNAVFMHLEVHDAVQFLRRMVHPESREMDLNVRGLAVTTPHKSAVMPCLDEIDPTAKEIGAVNTIVVREGRLLGYNTDAAGFVAPLRAAYGSLQNARCAVLGAGGAARACLWALRREGAACTVFARNPQKAGPLARAFGLDCRPIANSGFGDFDIVINSTPLGTRGTTQDETPAGVEQLRGVRLAYDLVYNPIETRFLRAASEAGCSVLGGMEMLLSQAVEQFRLWTGLEPDAGVMRASALAKYDENSK